MKDKIKILFIGNSHTYFNDMAYMLKYFSMQNYETAQIEPVTLVHPGKTLEEHKVEPEVRFNILYGDYDYVVLQQAAHPFPGEYVLIRDGKEINEFIKNTSAAPIVYMTWAEKAHPESQEVMTKSYLKLSKEINGLVAPAGIAFEKLQRTAPDIELFNKDGEHASSTGSYLIACIFYSVIYKKSPLGLPSRVMYKDQCLCEVDAETAKLLQNTAWSTLLELNS